MFFNMTDANILIVEDDLELAQWMSDYLQQYNFIVTLHHEGDHAVELIQDTKPDVLILDINLPGKNGFDICKSVREKYQNPIIMMTANDEELNEVLGLELGADDYLSKPITPRVLLARINAQLRRQNKQKEASQQILEFGGLQINMNAQTVILDDELIELSSAEFELLWVLASHAGKEIMRQDLIKEIRGFDYDGFDRSIDVRISRIRKKLHDSQNPPKKIKTIWGKGYLFVANAW